MLVGLWPPWADSTSSIYKAGPEGQWQAADRGIPKTVIYSLLSTSAGVILALSPNSVYASVDSGSSWLESDQLNVVALWGLLDEGPGGIWMAATFGSPTQSGLWHLISNGEIIDFKPLFGKLVADTDVRVYSIATTTNEGQILIASGRRVYVSNDEAETFQVLLETEKAVHLEVNPTNPLELVAIADSLYVSEDGGMSWTVSSLPGHKLGRPAVAWDQRKLALPVLDQLGGTVYVRKLGDY